MQYHILNASFRDFLLVYVTKFQGVGLVVKVSDLWLCSLLKSHV